MYTESHDRAIVSVGINEGYTHRDFTRPRSTIINVSAFPAIIGSLILTFANYLSYQTPMDFAFGAYFRRSSHSLRSATHTARAVHVSGSSGASGGFGGGGRGGGGGH